jgi:hypothetical protein
MLIFVDLFRLQSFGVAYGLGPGIVSSLRHKTL